MDGLEGLPVAQMLRKSQLLKNLERNILDRSVSKCKGPCRNGTCVAEPERTVGQSLLPEGRERTADHGRPSVRLRGLFLILTTMRGTRLSERLDMSE